MSRPIRRLVTRVTIGLLLLIGILVLAAGFLSGGTVQQSAAAASFPLGVYVPPNNTFAPVAVFPCHAAGAIDYYGWYEQLAGNQLTFAQQAETNGTESFIELQSGDYSLTSIAAGTYDAYLQNLAAQIGAFSYPVLMTFDHEMNGGWYPWGAGKVAATDWVAAWQHVVSVMRPAAPNITWVWAPNAETQGVGSFKPYWPGAAYVDQVGLDGYLRTSTATFSSVFGNGVTDARSLTTAPVFIAETGVASGSNQAAQIRSLVSAARTAGMTALYYFDKGTWALSGHPLKVLCQSADG